MSRNGQVSEVSLISQNVLRTLRGNSAWVMKPRVPSVMRASPDAIVTEAFYHTFKELEILNILKSLRTGGSEVFNAHDSIHEFILLAPLCLPRSGEVSWHQKSAYLTYHWEAFHAAHSAVIEALSGHYNAGYTLLRNTLELLIKGAFWECLTRREFRDHARILEEDKRRDKKRSSVVDWIEELIKRKSSIGTEIEDTSAGIFDKIAILFEDEDFQREYVRIPSFSVMVRQLMEWGIIDISDAYRTVYQDLYTRLSKDVHVIPDRTDIGRRLLLEKDLFEIDILPQELGKFARDLHTVMDIGIVVELGILTDWLEREEVKDATKERLRTMEGLGLKLGCDKLRRLLEA